MTDRDSPTPSGAQPHPGAVPAQFCINSARYSIDANSTTSDIGTDIGCALESLEELLHTAAERAADDSKTGLLVYAAINLVQQVQGLTSEYITRAARSAEMPMRQDVASEEPAGMPSVTSVGWMAGESAVRRGCGTGSAAGSRRVGAPAALIATLHRKFLGR